MHKLKKTHLALLAALGFSTQTFATQPKLKLSCERQQQTTWQQFYMHVSYWHEGNQHVSLKFEHQADGTHVRVSRKQQQIDSGMTTRIESASQAKAWAYAHQHIASDATRVYPVFHFQSQYESGALDCSETIANSERYLSRLVKVEPAQFPEPMLLRPRHRVSVNRYRNTYVKLNEPIPGQALKLIVQHEGNDIDADTYELTLEKTAHDFATHPFMETTDVSHITGISAHGEVIAVDALHHLQLDVMYGSLETLIVRGGRLYRLPLQKTINTYHTLSGSALSNDGNRVVVAHGLSIQLYEYHEDKDAYVLVGKQSLTHLLPHDYYKERSLRLAINGFQAFFQTQKGKTYRIDFINKPSS